MAPNRDSERIRVRVACSTSNLGPGFDFMGLCLGMHLEATAVITGSPREHAIRYDDPPDWDTEQDLFLRGLRAYEAALTRKLPSLSLRVTSEIPVGRGFGSSGAAVAAALVLAASVDGNREALADRARYLVPLGLDVEGHPDNSSASLLGGCTLAVPHSDGVAVVQQPVHPSLRFAVAWPDAPLFTEEARRVLPASVPHGDAVENPRRLALLLEGLRVGDGDLIRLGLEDRLHERFRRALIPGSDEACQAARSAGAFGACLSGAGSGVVAIGPEGAQEAMAAALARPLTGGTSRVVPFVADAPQVEYQPI